VVVPPEAREAPEVRPLVVQIDARSATTALSPRLGRTLGVLIVVAVVVTAAIGIGGLVLGLGAATSGLDLGGAARPLRTFGGSGIGPGLFTDARSIGLDGDGNIYVGEYQGGRVQVFDPQGEFSTQWFADREFPLTGMAVRRDGVVLTVQRGGIVLRDGSTGQARGSIAYDEGDEFEDAALQADGGLLTFWYGNRDDLVVFDGAGGVRLQIPEAISGQTGDSELGAHVAAVGNGDLLALGEFNEAVFHFGPDGRFLNRFGAAGDEPGQLRAPLSIAVDGQGRVYVGDIWGIEIFELDGRFVRRMDVEGSPYGLTVDTAGHLWVVNGTQVAEYALEGG
jgi:hypothetical protein